MSLINKKRRKEKNIYILYKIQLSWNFLIIYLLKSHEIRILCSRTKRQVIPVVELTWHWKMHIGSLEKYIHIPLSHFNIVRLFFCPSVRLLWTVEPAYMLLAFAAEAALQIFSLISSSRSTRWLTLAIFNKKIGNSN